MIFFSKNSSKTHFNKSELIKKFLGRKKKKMSDDFTIYIRPIGKNGDWDEDSKLMQNIDKTNFFLDLMKTFARARSNGKALPLVGGFLAFDTRDQLVAYITFWAGLKSADAKDYEDTMEIQNLCVIEKYKGKNIDNALYEKCHKKAEKSYFKNLVFSRNVKRETLEIKLQTLCNVFFV